MSMHLSYQALSYLVLTHCVLRCDGAVVGCCGGGRQEGDHDHHADHGRADHRDGRRVLWTGR